MRKQTKIAALVSAATLLAIGASMTSFAAGWTQQTDGTWQYLDSYGDPVTDEWHVYTDGQYYYFDSNGDLATEQLIDYNDHTYWVDASGRRAVDKWVDFENVDGIQVDGKEVSTLYRYFDSKGQMIAGTSKDLKKSNSTPDDKAKFFFDQDGYMISGWYDNGDDTYYLGEEDQGWALASGWVKMAQRDETLDIFDEETDVYYYFQSNGKIYKNTRKYLDDGHGRMSYFAFKSTGVMVANEWSAIGRATGAETYYDDLGYQKSGWVKGKNGDDKSWFYLSSGGAAFNRGTIADTDKTTRGTAVKWSNDTDSFNKGTDNKNVLTGVVARVIKNKTYLFDSNGVMLTGLYRLDGVGRVGSSAEDLDGIYLFDTTGGSAEGGMITNKKLALDDDDITRNYSFGKNGKAAEYAISGSTLYMANGVREDSDDSTWMVVKLNHAVTSDKNTDPKDTDDTEKLDTLAVGDQVVVNASGRVRESGNVTIDGVRYYIKNAPTSKPANYKPVEGAREGVAYVVVGTAVVD